MTFRYRAEVGSEIDVCDVNGVVTTIYAQDSGWHDVRLTVDLWKDDYRDDPYMARYLQPTKGAVCIDYIGLQWPA